MPSHGVEESPAASLILFFQNRGLARGDSGQSPKSMLQLQGYSNNGEAISACAPVTQHRDTQAHSGTDPLWPRNFLLLFVIPSTYRPIPLCGPVYMRICWSALPSGFQFCLASYTTKVECGRYAF